jgi:uncharacterized membrane protein (UPF0127 family)
MPVAVSMMSVVVRCAALAARWPRGVAGFLAGHEPWRTCQDGRLAAVRLEDEELTLAVLRDLQQVGIELFPRGQRGAPGDVAVVSERRGPVSWWPWLELAVVTLADGRRVLAAREAGSASADVVEPGPDPAWLARRERRVVALRPVDRPLDFVRREADAAVYVDRFNGEEVRVRLGRPSSVEVRTADGRAHEVRVDVARAGDAIEVGLMHRDRLDDDAGMLFVYPEEEPLTFWMKNTRIPLDMLFLRADGTVADVVERAEPMSLRSRGGAMASSVLEVNGGWAAARGVRVGDRVVRRPR